MLPAFATSLVFVTYSYTGWNSASYIAGEIKDVQKNLPKSLIIGTVFVTVSYLLVNYIMLKHAPVSQLAGKEDVMGKQLSICWAPVSGRLLIFLLHYSLSPPSVVIFG